jgi:hypothetical protein
MSKCYSFVGRTNGMKVFSCEIACENVDKINQGLQGLQGNNDVDKKYIFQEPKGIENDGPQRNDGVVIYPIFAPINNLAAYGFTGTNSGMGCSDNGELLILKDGFTKFRIGSDYIDLCNCLSQIKHKKIKFDCNVAIFTLHLNPNSSYMVNIRAIVSKGETSSGNPEISDSYYQGIATIKVAGNGNVHLDVPSESVFSSGFSWNWEIGPSLVEFRFSGMENQVYSASGRLDILSSGDTKFSCF